MKYYRLIPLTILFAILSVFSLATITGLFNSIPKNGFSRNFLGEMTVEKKVEKPSQLKRCIGKMNNRLWFTTSIANELYSSNMVLDDFRKEQLNMPLYPKWQSANIHFIQSEQLLSWAPQVPALYQIETGGDKKTNTVVLPTTFTRGLILSPTSYILRAFLPKGKSYEQVFVKYNSTTNSIVKGKAVIEDIGDLGMLTDGMLHFDTTTSLAIYVQYFSNNVTWIDTNLNVIHRGHTIDTFTHTRASMEVYKKDKKTQKATFNAPPQFINLYSKVYNGLLFNYSGKRADNEETEGYTGGSKIDIYTISNGKYLGTLKIPLLERGAMESFDIIDGHLIAIYKDQISLFKISDELFTSNR